MRFKSYLLLACIVAFLSSLCSAADVPNPALIVLVKGASELAIVDPVSLKILARVPTGEAPHEVALSKDGKTAYTSNYGARTPGNSISVIDLATQKETKRIDLGALRRPHGLVESGGKLYFTAEANRVVGRLDPQSGAVDWLMGTGQSGTHMLVINRDESKILTSNIGSDSLTLFERNANGAWNVTTIPVGKGPEAIALSPDGKEVWSAHSRDGGLSVLDVATGKVVQTIPIGTQRSNRASFTNDGKQVLISDIGGELLLMDAASRQVTKHIKLPGQPEGVLVTPDNQRAFVGLGNANAVAVVDLKTGTMTGKIDTGAETDGLAWAQR